MEKAFMIRTKNSLLGAAAAASLIGLPSFSLAGVDVGVFVEKPFVELGKASPKLSVSGFNDGADTPVDVHFGLIAPDGTIYEYPDWNTALKPWLSSFTLPAGLRFPATEITDLNNVPGGLTPGVWHVASALTKPGTLEFLAVDAQPFTVVDPTAGVAPGTRYGTLTLTLEQGGIQRVKSADAIFMGIDTGGVLEQLADAYVGTQPPVDTCLFNEVPVNLGDITDIQGLIPRTLDAGDTLSLSGGGDTLAVPRNAEALQAMNIKLYHADVPEGFYQSGAEYTFSGAGGVDIGAFSAKAVAPEPLTLSQLNTSSLITQSASADMPLRWNGNHGKGLVRAELSSVTLGSTTTVYSISCLFADDGDGVIPGSLISRLKSNIDANGTDLSGILASLGNGDSISGVDLGSLDLSSLGIDTSTLDLNNLDLGALGLGGANISPVTLTVGRSSITPFNTEADELSAGFFIITSGATGSVTLN